MYLFRQYFFKRYQHILTITTNTIALLLLLLVNNMSIYLNNELSGYLSLLSFDVSMLQIIDEKINYSLLERILKNEGISQYSYVNKSVYKDIEILCVDKCFFDIFQIPFQDGNKFIKESKQIQAIVSNKIFVENGCKQEIIINGCNYKISAVIDKDYSNIYFEIDNTIILSTEKINDMGQSAVFIKSSNRIDFSRYFSEDQLVYLDQSNSKESFMFMMKLVRNIMIVLSSVSILIAILSLLNNTLNNINKEKREIGIKKAMAASNIDIIKQYLFDIAFTILISCAMAYFLLNIIILVTNHLFELKIKVNIMDNVFPLTFILFISIFLGLYPAYKTSKITILSSLAD